MFSQPRQNEIEELKDITQNISSVGSKEESKIELKDSLDNPNKVKSQNYNNIDPIKKEEEVQKMK